MRATPLSLSPSAESALPAAGVGLAPNSLEATLGALQHSLASQMDALMGRLGDVLRPTTERLNRLERAVEKLADAVHRDAVCSGLGAAGARSCVLVLGFV